MNNLSKKITSNVEPCSIITINWLYVFLVSEMFFLVDLYYSYQFDKPSGKKWSGAHYILNEKKL